MNLRLPQNAAEENIVSTPSKRHHVHPFDADLNHEATQTAVDDSIRSTADEIPFLTPHNSWMEPEVPATTGLAIHTNASDHSGSPQGSADWFSQFVDLDANP
jgi:hypothetical protein